jgi:ABC-type proline/glycine betaine transport system substrate-binding protein
MGAFQGSLSSFSATELGSFAMKGEAAAAAAVQRHAGNSSTITSATWVPHQLIAPANMKVSQHTLSDALWQWLGEQLSFTRQLPCGLQHLNTHAYCAAHAAAPPLAQLLQQHKPLL